VFIGRYTLALLPNVKGVDAIATAGLFGTVSGSTLVAALTLLESENVAYEPWAAALYPFMDIPALVTAIVLARLYTSNQKKRAAAEDQISAIADEPVQIWPIIKESLQGSALSALLLGLALGLFTQRSHSFGRDASPMASGGRTAACGGGDLMPQPPFLTTRYRLLLRLYPRSFRQEFAALLTEAAQQREQSSPAIGISRPSVGISLMHTWR
jgi:hypothetical protein